MPCIDKLIEVYTKEDNFDTRLFHKTALIKQLQKDLESLGYPTKLHYETTGKVLRSVCIDYDVLLSKNIDNPNWRSEL